MLIFYELATTPIGNQQQQPTHPNDHLIPTVTPAGPPPVIKVPKLPGVQPPPMIQAAPQQPSPQPTPAGGTPTDKFGNVAKAVGAFGAGIATAALAHKFFGNHDENSPEENTGSTQKVSHTTTAQPAPLPVKKTTSLVRSSVPMDPPSSSPMTTPRTTQVPIRPDLSPTSLPNAYHYSRPLQPGIPARIGPTPFSNIHPRKFRLGGPVGY